MPHISRRELKTDEFRQTLAHTAEVLATHSGLIWRTAAVVLILALAGLLWHWYTGRQQARADAGLEQALETFEASVGNAPSAPGQMHFGTEQEKYIAAEQQFGQIARQYPWTRSGKLARYYAAIALERLGKYQDAANWLEPMTHSRKDPLAGLARFELAHIEEARGQGDRAVALLRDLLDHPSPLVPRAMVLLALGDHYRQSNPTEAARYYRQVQSEFSGSSMAEQARQRLELLGQS